MLTGPLSQLLLPLAGPMSFGPPPPVLVDDEDISRCHCYLCVCLGGMLMEQQQDGFLDNKVDRETMITPCSLERQHHAALV